MSKRPQFSLKVLFIITAVLAVPLGMMASGDEDLVQSGRMLVLPVLFGCIGYLLDGVRGVLLGLLPALSLTLLYLIFRVLS